jgi:hypothetical protein
MKMWGFNYDISATLSMQIGFSAALLWLAKANAGPAAIPRDEFDTSCLESPPDHLQGGLTRAARPIFQLVNGNGANSSSLGKILLAPGD